ncbi:MAG: hypothetical protein Q8M74_01850 [Chloroflexota bacterium]|nr:hypothetical protein [Chloroflexota bacterium]
MPGGKDERAVVLRALRCLRANLDAKVPAHAIRAFVHYTPELSLVTATDLRAVDIGGAPADVVRQLRAWAEQNGTARSCCVADLLEQHGLVEGEGD